MNVTPKLNLNKHPKDSDNLSLVNAHHVKISHDESCLTSEDSIRENLFIQDFLRNFYLIDPAITYDIVGIIPCNNELVIIVKPGNTLYDADIFRYQEPINNNIEKMYCAYGGVDSLNRFKYSGGLIKGAFTYNVENSLVVAITEYDVPNVKIPLRTINLGNMDDPTVYNDVDVNDSKLSVAPEVELPKVKDLDYVAGSAYKGWYYMFIRYKINSVDYTQWYSIGSPIYIDSLEQYQLIRYAFNRDTRFAPNPLNDIVYAANPEDGYGVGASDHFSNTSDIAKETFKVDLWFNDKGDYDKYQIGVICASKSYTKAFRTADIFLNKNYTPIGYSHIQSYILDNKSLVEYDANAFISDNFNYFNAKNVINYQNRLYISNYLEDNANDDDISQSIIDNINVNLVATGFRDYGLVFDTPLINNASVNQYDTFSMLAIPMHVYLNISEETIVSISALSHPPKTVKVGQLYIIASDGATPSFAFIELREDGGGGTINRTNYGKAPNQTIIYLTLPAVNGGTESNIMLDTNQLAINGGMKYINTNTDFDARKKNSSLIPGEVYNLHVHFTKKYGHSSNGYKLNNKTRWHTEDDVNGEIIPVPFNVRINEIDYIFYAALPVDANVAIQDFSTNNNYNVNTNNIKFYREFIDYSVQPRLTVKVLANMEAVCMAAFIEQFSSYANDKHINTKWYQISYGPGTNRFHLFINNNGDRLFKVPIVESYTLNWDGFPNEIVDFKTYQLHSIFWLSLVNVEIPEGYDGYYISYEKFEPQARVTGLLTRSDFRSQDYITVGSNNVVRATANTSKSDKMYLYSSLFDVSDTLKLDYNIMRIEAVNPFKRNDIPEWDYYQRNYSFNFFHDMNKPQTESYGKDVLRTYAMPDYKIAVANSSVDNRIGVGTALQINDAYNLFPNYKTDDAFKNRIRLYRVTLLNTTRDIYMSNNKNLVRLTDIYYREDGLDIDHKYETGLIVSGYNGHYTYDGIPIYENAGVAFNTTTNKVHRTGQNTEYYQPEVAIGTPHTYQNDIPFFAYLQLPICTDIFFESKSFKNPPQPVIYNVKTIDGRPLFAKGSMIIPVNSIDLFENRQGSADQFNPKTYTNFRDDLVSIERFDKTVRRSNVIQDESRINGWRTFPVEGYKNITENKGKITNLIGIGTVLLAHTEHSLFMFNTDSTLRTQDRDIQLVQPDAFEVSYQEVFTSDKGFGGLQDDKSFIVDQFGYIFYSEDTNRIYRFDNKSLDYLDEDILQWLLRYRPYGIRIANDKFNNRLLIKFNYKVGVNINSIILSYNYKTKCFVSQHFYHFDEAFNTKTGLYLKCDNSHTGCSLHSFIYNGSQYRSFDNVFNKIGEITILASRLSIIINSSYETVKHLEFITYKMTKYADATNVDFTHSPVEAYIEPFAGDLLTVYNNQINTGTLNVFIPNSGSKNIFAAYDKPYWDLGVWNFSYLRNKVNMESVGLSHDHMSRLFGNYFIVEFEINNLDCRQVDFEELNYSVSES